MIEVHDLLHKSNTWVLIPKSEIELCYYPLGSKWVYKIKQDIKGKIACFKRDKF